MIYMKRSVAEYLKIRCSEVVELCDNDIVLVNPRPITIQLLHIHGLFYYEDLMSIIYS